MQGYAYDMQYEYAMHMKRICNELWSLPSDISENYSKIFVTTPSLTYLCTVICTKTSPSVGRKFADTTSITRRQTITLSLAAYLGPCSKQLPVESQHA
jgi:hypothetical protein